LGISLFTFLIKWISTDFYRIKPFFSKTDGIEGADFLVSASFLNTELESYTSRPPTWPA
jgi:hypothetical protein